MVVTSDLRTFLEPFTITVCPGAGNNSRHETIPTYLLLISIIVNMTNIYKYSNCSTTECIKRVSKIPYVIWLGNLGAGMAENQWLHLHAMNVFLSGIQTWSCLLSFWGWRYKIKKTLQVMKNAAWNELETSEMKTFVIRFGTQENFWKEKWSYQLQEE